MASAPGCVLLSRRASRGWVVLWLASIALSACKSSAESQASVPTSVSPSPPSAGPPSVSPDELTLSGQAAWAQAALGDPLDQARVARREGALRLLAEVRAGSPRAAFALELLPLAPDAEAELGVACALLPRASGADRSRLLGAVAGVLARGPANSERTGVAGLRDCARTLSALRHQAQGQDADHIESALEQLRQRSVNTN